MSSKRRQERHKKRVEKEAYNYLHSLILAFLKFTQTQHDIDSQEVLDVFNKADAQWKAYCKKYSLLKAFNVFADEMNKVLDSMRKIEKEKREPGPYPLPPSEFENYDVSKSGI